MKPKEDLQNSHSANGLDKTSGKLEQVVLYSHSGTDGPVFHGQRGLDQFNRALLGNIKVNWAGGATAFFCGCRTTLKFAQAFANAQWRPYLWLRRLAYFSPSPNERVDGPFPSGTPFYLIYADGAAYGALSALKRKSVVGRIPFGPSRPRTTRRPKEIDTL